MNGILDKNLPATHWLKLRYEDIKKRNHSYSLRSFASKIDISISLLSQILKGKKSISKQTFNKISNSLNLNTEQRTEFELAFNKEQLFLKNKKKQGKEFISIELDIFKCISNPKHFILLNLIRFHRPKDCKDEKFAKIMSCSVDEIRVLLDRLVKLDFIKKRNNTYQACFHNEMVKDSDVPNQAIQYYQTHLIETAAQSLKSMDVALRDITSTMMMIDINDMDRAKEFIRKFRLKFCDKFEVKNNDINKNNVQLYGLNVQLYPLTDSSLT